MEQQSETGSVSNLWQNVEERHPCLWSSYEGLISIARTYVFRIPVKK
jgi:hypothetical protein